ncbi:TetR/AcrR family transcriptional regulator [Spirosoma humi]
MNTDTKRSVETSSVRQRILETAGRLFYRQGYNSTGINQLISEAGVAKASLYQHFKTKEDILKAYLAETSQAWFELVHKTIDAHSTTKEKVLALFDMLRDTLINADFRGCNFQNATIELAIDEIDIRQFIQTHKSRMRQIFADLLISTGTDVADEVTLLFEGAMITSQLYQNKEPIDTAYGIVNRLL